MGLARRRIARGGAPRAAREEGGRSDERERARRRHAHVVHRLRHEVLAHRRAQHRAAVAAARERRRAGALQLQLPALAARERKLAERRRAAVAVAVAAAERVGRVDRLAEDRDGVRRRPRAAAARRRPAREERHELGVGRRGRVEAERREHIRAGAHQERVRQRLGLDVDPEAERLARLAVRVRGVAVRVGRQRLLDRVVAALEKRAHRRRRRRTAAHHPSTRANGAENCAWDEEAQDHAARCCGAGRRSPGRRGRRFHDTRSPGVSGVKRV